MGILGVITAAAIIGLVNSEIDKARLEGSMEERMKVVESATKQSQEDFRQFQTAITTLDKTVDRLDMAVVELKQTVSELRSESKD
jgi:septal ring factor EnvC (AmiA/AmiB activator)